KRSFYSNYQQTSQKYTLSLHDALPISKKVIVTGRNEQSLKGLLEHGADEIISLKQDNEAFVSQLKALHQQKPIDIVIDYLWGQSAELILSALKGNGGFSHRTRYVTVGGMTGDTIDRKSTRLNSSNVKISYAV